MWSYIRQEIERARRELGLTSAQFKPLGLAEWSAVEKRLYQEFTEQIGKPTEWTWKHPTTKKPFTALSFGSVWSHEYLVELVEPDEVCFVCFDGETKAWWYQGTASAIVAVSAEIWGCEIGVMSKQYDWLLYINHHDVLCAFGEPMTNRLQHLAERLGLLDKWYQRPAMARPAR